MNANEWLSRMKELSAAENAADTAYLTARRDVVPLEELLYQARQTLATCRDNTPRVVLKTGQVSRASIYAYVYNDNVSFMVNTSHNFDCSFEDMVTFWKDLGELLGINEECNKQGCEDNHAVNDSSSDYWARPS